METQNPPALCRVSIRSTSTGTVITVAVLTPGAIAWRSYRHEVGCDLDRAVAAALRSCGIARAWACARLPL